MRRRGCRKRGGLGTAPADQVREGRVERPRVVEGIGGLVVERRGGVAGRTEGAIGNDGAVPEEPATTTPYPDPSAYVLAPSTMRFVARQLIASSNVTPGPLTMVMLSNRQRMARLRIGPRDVTPCCARS